MKKRVNYDFARRKKEQERQRKKEEKLQRRQESRAQADESPDPQAIPVEGEGATTQS